MDIKTTIVVTIKGTNLGTFPVSLTWDSEKHAGDNPRFIPSEVKEAIREACAKATDSVDKFEPAKSVVVPKVDLNVIHASEFCVDSDVDKRIKCTSPVSRVSDPYRANMQRVPKVWLCEKHEERRIKRVEEGKAE